eukprot:4547039-Prymnesium_polylepis.1
MERDAEGDVALPSPDARRTPEGSTSGWGVKGVAVRSRTRRVARELWRIRMIRVGRMGTWSWQ